MHSLPSNAEGASAHALARGRSVARRVTAIGIGMMALVLLALSLAVSYISTNAARAQLKASVIHATEGLVASIDTVDQANRRMVERSASAFARYFQGPSELDTASGTLSHNGSVINANFALVDQFSEDTGGVATVFARKGDDFVRITTSLRNLQGERVMNTQLDRNHPAYALMLAGQPYVGRANLFGKPYMTAYAPMRDAAGQIVGILFVGSDLSAFQEGMQQQVTNTRLFEHGGAMVIDPHSQLDQAVFVAHRTHAGEKVLERFPAARASLENLHQDEDGFVQDVTPLMPAQGEHPWAVLRKTQAGWWVITEVSDDEAMASQRKALMLLWAAMAVALAVLAVGLFVTLRRGVSAPLRELTQAITLIAQGDLTHPFRSQRRDEGATWCARWKACASAMSACCVRSTMPHTALPAPAAKLRKAMWTWPSAPKTPPTTWPVPPKASKKSRTACTSRPWQRAKPMNCRPPPPKLPRVAARW